MKILNTDPGKEARDKSGKWTAQGIAVSQEADSATGKADRATHDSKNERLSETEEEANKRNNAAAYHSAKAAKAAKAGNHGEAAAQHRIAADEHGEAAGFHAAASKDGEVEAHTDAAAAHTDAATAHTFAAAHHDVAGGSSARNRTPILNRDFTHPTDGWYHIEPRGEHPNRAADIVQVVDAEACEAIANRFNADADAGKLSHGKEMLIDHEHFKHDSSKETRAFGWLCRLENRDDGLYGKIRWTDTGKAAVDGGDYRFFSTEYDAANLTVLNKDAKTVRPTALDGLTLTNQPNNRGGRPITNSDRNPALNNADNQNKKSMKKIATALGLSADASEEEVIGEVGKINNRITELEADQIDADLESHGVKDAAVINRLKPVLAGMKNRAERKSFLSEVVAAPAAAAQRKLLNRDGHAPNKAGTDAERANATKIANRAAELRKGCPTLTQASAFIQARAEIEG